MAQSRARRTKHICLPAGLDGPVVLPDLGGGEAAGGARLLLDVEGHLRGKE